MVAESLNEDVNMYNMKKVQVNAQVKAMISLLEASINMCYVLLLLFTVRTSLGTLMIQTSTYLIFLPYFSLMNTSYNKDRIIENGWDNVFRNLWVKKNPNRDQVDQPISIQNNMDVQEQWKSPSDYKINESQNLIFRISSSDLNIGRKNKIGPEKDIASEIASEVGPSTSKGKFLSTKNQPPESKRDKNKPGNKLGNSITVIDKIVLKMSQHTHEEHVYIKYFEQLIDYVSSSRERQQYLDENFQDIILPNSILDISHQQRNSVCKGKSSNSRARKSNKQPKLKMSLNANELLLKDKRRQFDGNKYERKLFRDNILKEIQSSGTNNHDRNLLIEKLIDKEESYLL